MSLLIVCLGNELAPNGAVPPVLANRLDQAVAFLDEDPTSRMLLMGGASYRDMAVGRHTEASAMRLYLARRLQAAALRRVMIEATTASTVEQLCWLRQALDDNLITGIDDSTRIVIIASEFFSARVKLYCEYIFNRPMEVVSAHVPAELTLAWRETESAKLAAAKDWLARFQKGDYQSMLAHQRSWQRLVVDHQADRPQI